MAENTLTQVINIESKYQDKGLAELKKVLAGTQLAMNNLSKAGKENSDSYIKLQARTVALTARMNELKGVYSKVATATKEVATHTSTAGSKLQSLTSSLPILSLGLAGAAAGIVNFVGTAFTMGASFQEMKSNFVGSAQDLELFRKATAGTVSDGGLIQLSNYASDLGLSLKDQALLFSLAEDAADKYGGTTEENFQRVVNASDGSAKGLRAIGIGVKEYNKELEKLLPNNVKNIDDLDAETQQQIRLEAIIKAKGITIDDVMKKQQSNADVIANLGNLYETFAVNVGLAVNENTKMSSSFRDMTPFVADLGKAFGGLLVDIKNATSGIVDFFKDAMYGYLEFFNLMTEKDKDMRDQARIDKRISELEQADEQKKNNSGAYLPSKEDYEKNKSNTTKTKTSSSRGGSTEVKKQVEKSAIALLLEAVQGVERDSKFSNFIFDNLKVTSDVGTYDPLNGGGIDLVNQVLGKSSIEEIKTGLNLDDTLQTSEEIYNNISGLMNILNVGTDTFVGKLLAGFNSAFQVMGIVRTLLSFIPGGSGIAGMARASGGMVNSGGTYLVGENGPEILRMSGSGMVYNNSQTNKLLNTSLNKSAPINVYVSSNIDQRFLKVGIEQYNSNQKYLRA